MLTKKNNRNGSATYSVNACSCDGARADGRAFSLRAVNRMFSFAAFFIARTTLCNTIRSPCDETWTRCPGAEI